jgi:hypothetical protein
MLSGARAQACVPFRGSPGTAHKCDTFLVPGTNVFLAPDQTYESVDAAAGNFTHLFGAFMPPDCRTAGLRLLCLSWFLPCDFSSTGLAGSSPPLFIRFLSLFASFCFFCSAPARWQRTECVGTDGDDGDGVQCCRRAGRYARR